MPPDTLLHTRLLHGPSLRRQKLALEAFHALNLALLHKTTQIRIKSKKAINYTSTLAPVHMWAPRSHLTLEIGQKKFSLPMHVYVQMHNYQFKKMTNNVNSQRSRPI